MYSVQYSACLLLAYMAILKHSHKVEPLAYHILQHDPNWGRVSTLQYGSAMNMWEEMVGMWDLWKILVGMVGFLIPIGAPHRTKVWALSSNPVVQYNQH